jgi:hypothetical protein
MTLLFLWKLNVSCLTCSVAQPKCFTSHNSFPQFSSFHEQNIPISHEHSTPPPTHAPPPPSPARATSSPSLHTSSLSWWWTLSGALHRIVVQMMDNLSSFPISFGNTLSISCLPSALQLWRSLLKGTVQWDFLTPVFFTKRLILVSMDMPKSNFEIFRIFAELFEL